LGKALANRPRFEPEQPLPTLISGDIALTSTPTKDEAGARAQVVRRQPHGSWLRLLDQPEFVLPHPLNYLATASWQGNHLGELDVSGCDVSADAGFAELKPPQPPPRRHTHRRPKVPATIRS